MNETEKESIKNTWRELAALRDDFSKFSVGAKLQLLVGQLQFFQSLSAIILAFVAIIIAVRDPGPSPWLILSALFAIFLIVYTSSYTREVMDSQSTSLDRTAELFEEGVEEVEKKMFEAFENGDPGVFFDFVRAKTEPHLKPGESLNYAGEICVFLFSSSLLFCLISIVYTLYPNEVLVKIPGATLSLVIFCASVCFAFKDWSLLFTERISAIISATLFPNRIHKKQ